MKHNQASTFVTAPHRLAVVDVTDELLRAIKDSGVTDGCAIAFCSHTTCALIVNELEDGVIEDLTTRLTALIPDDGYYAHDDFDRRTQNLIEDERTNGPAHVAAMILGGTSHAIPVEGGEPVFGEWQRLLLLELDEPKPRTLRFHIFGD